MFKHSVRVFICINLFLFSLIYSINAYAEFVIKATPGNQQITLQWAPVADATNYGVCYATEAIVTIKNCLNYTDSHWPDTSGTTLILTNLTNGKPYYFSVLAENAIAILDVSNTITAIPNVSNTTTSRLNDTGIVNCANAGNNSLPCPVAGYPNQDAQSGRDVSQDDENDGHAGFSFTKIDNSGAPLTVDAFSWNCVKDNVTGLMWEAKTDDNGLHDQDWTYTWYLPDNSKNGGAVGAKNGGSCRNTSACDTDAYVKKVNTVGWCGYKDWRMPTVEELAGIASLDRYSPSIDNSYFPNTQSNYYWTSSPVAFSSNLAWIVHFNFGYDFWYIKSGAYSVRLVRSGQ